MREYTEPGASESKKVLTHTHAHTHTVMQFVRRTQKTIEIAPSGQSWNKLSNKTNDAVLCYISKMHELYLGLASRVKCGKRVKSNFIVGKPGKCYLSQAVQEKLCWEHSPLTGDGENALILCDLPPKTHKPSLTTRKTSDQPKLRDTLQIPVKIIKTGKV